jgi:hypothetical protein
MAVNVYEIQEVSPGQIRTNLTMADGCTMMEMHRIGLTDQDVLLKFNQKYYKHLKGTWQITWPREHKVIKENDLSTAIQRGLAYIYERDHPEEPDYFC